MHRAPKSLAHHRSRGCSLAGCCMLAAAERAPLLRLQQGVQHFHRARRWTVEPFGHGSIDRMACQRWVSQGCCLQG